MLKDTNHSRIMIETNMIQPELTMKLSAEPNIVVEAGTRVTLKSEVKADSISKSEYSDKTKWKVISSSLKNNEVPNAHTDDDFLSDSGSNAIFKTRLPYDTIKIEGRAVINNKQLTDTITIITTPGPDYKIYIEPILLS